MVRHLATLALTLLAGSALAQSHHRDDLVRGLCRPDGCDEFAILAADRLTATSEGALFRTRVKTFHASSAGRKELGQENGYVYCSRTKPAIMSEQGGTTMAFLLAPFARAESRESVRLNANFHALYFAICHNMAAGRAAVHDLAGVAQSHGYRVALAQSKLVRLNRAEDIVASPTPPPAVARPEQGEERPPAEVVGRELREPMPPAPRRSVERDGGWLAGPRRLTDRTIDAFEDMEDWVLGRGRE